MCQTCRTSLYKPENSTCETLQEAIDVDPVPMDVDQSEDDDDDEVYEDAIDSEDSTCIESSGDETDEADQEIAYNTLQPAFKKKLNAITALVNVKKFRYQVRYIYLQIFLKKLKGPFCIISEK